MSQSKPIDYQVRFAGALFVGFFMAAIGWWAMESGYRVAAASAAITFVLIWLYAFVAWGFWLQARRDSRRIGLGSDS